LVRVAAKFSQTFGIGSGASPSAQYEKKNGINAQKQQNFDGYKYHGAKNSGGNRMNAGNSKLTNDLQNQLIRRKFLPSFNILLPTHENETEQNAAQQAAVASHGCFLPHAWRFYGAAVARR
jgi:hypothetical protein